MQADASQQPHIGDAQSLILAMDKHDQRNYPTSVNSW